MTFSPTATAGASWSATGSRSSHASACGFTWPSRRAGAATTRIGTGATSLLSDPRPPLRRVDMLVSYPVATPTGRILTTPTYDPGSFILYTSGGPLDGIVEPSPPTDGELAAAKAVIVDELLGALPLATPADASRAMALLLSIPLRPLIRRSVPLFVVTSPGPGSGKTRLLESFAYAA